MVKSFHNTTGETGTTLDDFVVQAEEQEERILEYVTKHPNLQFTSENLEYLFPGNTPLTSIRRAVCNLKRKGEVRVVGKSLGKFNRPIYLYQFKGE
jgi:hypothetical protein